MEKISQKIERFIFSGKVQGPGSLGVGKLMALLLKAVVMGKFFALLSYAKFIVFSKSAKAKNLPFVMACFVNSKCNLNCPYCCYGVPENSHLGEQYGEKALLGGCRDMSLDDFKKMCDLSLFKNVLAAVFSGGEPLLNKDFFSIVEYAGKQFPIVHLTTNGTLIGESLEKIMNSPITHINISLDSYDENGYRKMRSENNGDVLFNQVKKNILSLVKARNEIGKSLEIIVSTVCGKLNYTEMQNMIDFAKSLGVDSVNFQNIVGFGNVKLSSQSLVAEDGKVVSFIRDVKNRNRGFHVTYPRVLSTDKSIRGCRQAFDSLTLDADGNAGPCSVMVPSPKANYGNVFRDEVWNSDKMIALRRSLLDGKKELASDFCSDCTFLNGKLF